MPRDLAKERQAETSENVGPCGAAVIQDGLARTLHMGGVDVVADQLQSVVGLDRRADVEVALVIERPTAMLALAIAQIGADLVLKLLVDFIEVVFEQDIFRRNRRIRLQLVEPVAIRGLDVIKRGPYFVHGPFNGVQIISRTERSRVCRRTFYCHRVLSGIGFGLSWSARNVADDPL